ncbi:hypothetical protein C8R46DRAFT_1216369 [Mycena filopes]|nr:hypothetical protein C8R46DRAFT_1216369 [Mycena filopes]
MKSFFQRRPDTQPPPRSYTPANKVWLPPPDASRAPAAGQGGAIRNGGDTHRSSSRAGRDAPTSSAYKYATLPNNTTGFYYNPPPPPQPFPAQYYPPRPPSGGFDRPDSRAGYVPYPYPNPQYPQAFGGPLPPQPAVSKEKPRSTGDARAASVPPPALARPSSSKKHSQRDVPRKQPSSSSIKDQKPEGEVKSPKLLTLSLNIVGGPVIMQLAFRLRYYLGNLTLRSNQRRPELYFSRRSQANLRDRSQQRLKKRHRTLSNLALPRTKPPTLSQGPSVLRWLLQCRPVRVRLPTLKLARHTGKHLVPRRV